MSNAYFMREISRLKKQLLELENSVGGSHSQASQISDITGLQDELNQKAALSHSHTDNYATAGHTHTTFNDITNAGVTLTTALGNKADTATVTTLSNALANKANTGHIHTKDDISGFIDASQISGLVDFQNRSKQILSFTSTYINPNVDIGLTLDSLFRVGVDPGATIQNGIFHLFICDNDSGQEKNHYLFGILFVYGNTVSTFHTIIKTATMQSISWGPTGLVANNQTGKGTQYRRYLTRISSY